jgi:hypothetical protein
MRERVPERGVEHKLVTGALPAAHPEDRDLPASEEQIIRRWLVRVVMDE